MTSKPSLRDTEEQPMSVLKSASIAAAAIVFVLSIAPAAHAASEIAGAGNGQVSVGSDAQSVQIRWAQISAKAREFQVRRQGQFVGVKNASAKPRKAFMAMANQARNSQ
jgi:hypothetical protein